MTHRIPSTLEGKRKLEEELKRLRSEERPRIISAIEEAREKGDLSENAEYDAAKEAQQQLNQRLQEIEDALTRLDIITLDQIQDKEKVAFSATVTLLDINTDETKIYQIVGGHEADIQVGKISIQSPIGSTMIGKRKGDVVPVRTPRGIVEYEVLEVHYKS